MARLVWLLVGDELNFPRAICASEAPWRDWHVVFEQFETTRAISAISDSENMRNLRRSFETGFALRSSALQEYTAFLCC